jgi:hypothetical protein
MMTMNRSTDLYLMMTNESLNKPLSYDDNESLNKPLSYDDK